MAIFSGSRPLEEVEDLVLDDGRKVRILRPVEGPISVRFRNSNEREIELALELAGVDSSTVTKKVKVNEMIYIGIANPMSTDPCVRLTCSCGDVEETILLFFAIDSVKAYREMAKEQFNCYNGSCFVFTQPDQRNAGENTRPIPIVMRTKEQDDRERYRRRFNARRAQSQPAA